MVSFVLLLQSPFLDMTIILVVFFADLLEECDFLLVDGCEGVTIRESLN